MKKKVLCVFGTRPEAIKMCSLVNRLKEDERFDTKVCVTAQHREMLDSVLNVFGVKADYDLDIMSHGQTILDISSKVLYGVTDVINDYKPDLVLVHGDTTTTMNAALASFYCKVPVGHVEAGLRTGDMYSPFPEELNRKVTANIASIHFAPTIGNKLNLLQENIMDNVYVTGNTVIDSLLSVIKEGYIFEEDRLNALNFNESKTILLTTHRRENWGSNMENIFRAVRRIVNKNNDVQIVFPVHKNPDIVSLAKRYFAGEDRVMMIEPLCYLDFANLMSKCYLIMSDSGGVQEEAPALGKPVVVLREETERPEAIEASTVCLGGTDEDNIFNIVNNLLNDEQKYINMTMVANPYGDGHACENIINAIIEYFYAKKGEDCC